MLQGRNDRGRVDQSVSEAEIAQHSSEGGQEHSLVLQDPGVCGGGADPSGSLRPPPPPTAAWPEHNGCLLRGQCWGQMGQELVRLAPPGLSPGSLGKPPGHKDSPLLGLGHGCGAPFPEQGPWRLPPALPCKACCLTLAKPLTFSGRPWPCLCQLGAGPSTQGGQD